VTRYLQVITTTGQKDDARKLASALVEARLAGCVQVLGPITSTYRWQGAVHTGEEWLCFIKTSDDRYPALEEAIRGLHPYDVPEIIAVPVVEGSRSYLDWLGGALRIAQDADR